MSIVKSVIDHFEPLSDKDKLYGDSCETEPKINLF